MHGNSLHEVDNLSNSRRIDRGRTEEGGVVGEVGDGGVVGEVTRWQQGGCVDNEGDSDESCGSEHDTEDRKKRSRFLSASCTTP